MIKSRIILLVILIIIFIGSIELRKAVRPSVPSTPSSSDSSISDGTIKMSYSPETWALAVKPDQILVKAYIPPCTGNFSYCFYSLGKEYAGTNLESAGLAISHRDDLATDALCLTTPPEGFADLKPDTTVSKDAYSSSIFGNVSGAAAGHYANGSLYRLFIKKDSKCYELESRIAVTRFENYPEGSKIEFTADMQNKIKTQIDELINAFSLETGDSHLFR